MSRRLFRVRSLANVLAAGSLLLCVTAAVLWARSYGEHGDWQRRSGPPRGGERWDHTGRVDRDGQRITRTVALASSRGRLEFGAYRTTYPVPAGEFEERATRGAHEMHDPFGTYRPMVSFPPGAFFLILRTQDITSEVFVSTPPPETPRAALLKRLGLAWKSRPAGPDPYWLASVPHWMVVALTAVLPAWRVPHWFRFVRARRRRKRGQCEACGYDLRASTGRCPECGRPRN